MSSILRKLQGGNLEVFKVSPPAPPTYLLLFPSLHLLPPFPLSLSVELY